MLRGISLVYALALSLTCFSATRETERRVLVLYDKSEFQNLEYTFSLPHQKVETVFNHYGMVFDYIDVASLPALKAAQPHNYLGVLTWFTDPLVPSPPVVFDLLERFADAGKKLALLDELPIQARRNQTDDAMIARAQRLLQRFDVQLTGDYWSSLLHMELERTPLTHEAEFERPLKGEISPLFEARPLSSKLKGIANVARRGSTLKSLAVMEGERFFWAQNGYVLFRHPIYPYTRWRVNPFRLAKWFWGGQPVLFPDTTTMNGRRIYYGHIDGDGAINASAVDRMSLCGEIIDSEIIAKSPWPITVSFIAAEINELSKNRNRTQAMVRRMVARPHVRWATHSYTHPLSWNVIPTDFDKDAYLTDPSKYRGGSIVAYPLEKDYTIDYRREIKDSHDLIKSMLPDNRQQEKVLLWSGNCHPPHRAMRMADELGFYAINGGDSRFDRKFPSYSSVAPLYRRVGDRLQPYASNSNENTYTNNWTGPFHGFRQVVETFENTEKPVRIKPINIYFHFYSGEHKVSLAAVKTALDYVDRHDVFPIFIHEYVPIIKSFDPFKMTVLKHHHYAIQHGDLKELRLESDSLYVDMEQSKNVLGYKRAGAITYVHLGAEGRAEVKLTTLESKRPSLVESNARIGRLDFLPDGVEYQGDTSAPRHLLVLRNVKPFRPSPLVSSVSVNGAETTLTFKAPQAKLKLEYAP